MQVVARARAAGLLLRPRDIFVEQTVSRLAQVAVFADGEATVVDAGTGPVVATPIIRWLHGLGGNVGEFNQTVVLQAPEGVSEDDVVTVLQALLDRHATLRLRAEENDGEWALLIPEVGTVDARVPSRGRSAFRRGAAPCPVAAEPRDRFDAECSMGERQESLGVDRPPPGCRRGVVADPVGRLQHRLGAAPRRAGGGIALGRHVVCPVGDSAR
ncbi:Probable non-ribosomal peptide synthetase [Mycobacteroides abscessus subsp. abscessus]|nr:Probable non-ribosomal peptide synthetase [Mycobacteroides abscessus subsp. abscessus]